LRHVHGFKGVCIMGSLTSLMTDTRRSSASEHPYKTVVSRFVHRDVQSVSKRVLRDDRTINCALMSSDGPYVEQDRTSAPHEERRKGRQYRRRNIFLGQVDRTVHPGIGAARSQPERVTTRLGPTSRPWR